MQDIESRRRGRVVSSSRIVEIYFLSPSYNKIIIIRLIDTTLLLCADVPYYSINTTLLITWVTSRESQVCNSIAKIYHVECRWTQGNAVPAPSSYWDPAFTHLTFHKKSPEPLVCGPFWPKADIQFPDLWFSTGHVSIRTIKNDKAAQFVSSWAPPPNGEIWSYRRAIRVVSGCVGELRLQWEKKTWNVITYRWRHLYSIAFICLSDVLRRPMSSMSAGRLITPGHFPPLPADIFPRTVPPST